MFGIFGRNKTQTYVDPVEEYYRPHKGGKTEIEKSLALAHRMGRDGTPVTRRFLEAQANTYQSYLKTAKRFVELRIAELKARQKDPLRIVSFGLVFLAGLAVTTMAIFVDYTILEEIWSRNFANEFFEVPQILQSSVTFKSLQVVFAVLALHYFVSSIGKFGRGAFITILTAMVLTMLVGIGFLNTTYSLPVGSTLFGLDVTGETLNANDELAALGLSTETEATAQASAQDEAFDAAPPFGMTEANFETFQTVLFYMSFGMIFFFVSSVGALSLHYSIAAFTSFTGGTRGEKAQSDHARDARDRDHADLNMKLLRAEKVQTQIRHPEEAVAQFLSMFASSYSEGLVRGRVRNNGPKRRGLEELLMKSLEGATTSPGGPRDEVESEGRRGNVTSIFGRRSA